jgi:hypothetical protein
MLILNYFCCYNPMLQIGTIHLRKMCGMEMDVDLSTSMNMNIHEYEMNIKHQQ